MESKHGLARAERDGREAAWGDDLTLGAWDCSESGLRYKTGVREDIGVEGSRDIGWGVYVRCIKGKSIRCPA